MGPRSKKRTLPGTRRDGTHCGTKRLSSANHRGPNCIRPVCRRPARHQRGGLRMPGARGGTWAVLVGATPGAGNEPGRGARRSRSLSLAGSSRAPLAGRERDGHRSETGSGNLRAGGRGVSVSGGGIAPAAKSHSACRVELEFMFRVIGQPSGQGQSCM